MVAILTIIFFVFGLIIGSFLNVVICRYNTSKTLGGRSACMSCQTTLCWYELIPVFSFLALKGRCFNCKSKIGVQYPLVELLTGLIFALLFLKFQGIFYFNLPVFAISFVYYAFIFSLLTVIAVYDLRHKIIPDMLVLMLGVVSFIGLFFFATTGFYPHVPGLWEFLAGPIVALPFALLWLFSGGSAMGFGDAKLAIGLGWLLGLSRVFSALMLAVWSGAIIGVLLVFFSKKYKMKSEIPFAPFLFLGILIAFMFELNLFPFFKF